MYSVYGLICSIIEIKRGLSVFPKFMIILYSSHSFSLRYLKLFSHELFFPVCNLGKYGQLPAIALSPSSLTKGNDPVHIHSLHPWYISWQIRSPSCCNSSSYKQRKLCFHRGKNCHLFKMFSLYVRRDWCT